MLTYANRSEKICPFTNLKASTGINLTREFILVYFVSFSVFSTGRKDVLELGFTSKILQER